MTTQHANSKKLVPPFYRMDGTVKALEGLEGFKHVQRTIGDHPLHFVHTGKEDAPAVLFIHGSPGSWEAWAEYLHDEELRKRTFMIAVDRPGYGSSNNGTSGLSLKEQSKLIIEAVQKSFPKQKRLTVVGHSYGGPVALRLAIDNPEMVESMILLAPAIAPELVRIKWYNKLADLFFVRPFLSSSLHHSNEEMIPLRNELIKMESHLREIALPVTVIQGKEDWIVMPGNADFAKTSLANSTVSTIFLEERGHFIPWEEYSLVKNSLLKKIFGD